MYKKYIVRLSDEERGVCQEVIKKLKGSSQKARRAQLLLKADADGAAWDDAKISEAIGCRRQTVENVRQAFVVEGFEPTRIDGTDVMTLKIDRKRGPDAKRRVEIWMAPEFQWLPVRLRFTDTNDEVWDSVLSQLPNAPPPPDRIVQEPVKP